MEEVGRQLTQTRELIASLSRELDRVRAENRALVRERDQLKRSVDQLDVAWIEREVNQSRHQADLGRIKRQEERLRALQDENSELHRRCAELEDALRLEREANDVAMLELDLLEGQLGQLQAALDELQ